MKYGTAYVPHVFIYYVLRRGQNSVIVTMIMIEIEIMIVMEIVKVMEIMIVIVTVIMLVIVVVIMIAMEVKLCELPKPQVPGTKHYWIDFIFPLAVALSGVYSSGQSLSLAPEWIFANVRNNTQHPPIPFLFPLSFLFVFSAFSSSFD